MKGTMFRSFSLPFAGHTWTAESPVIVGIVNTTPDSFYAQSRANTADSVEAHAETLLEGGAHWLDIGGCSTRPDAALPSVEEEWSRVQPGLKRLADRFGEIPVSIDTFRGEIAARALDAGACMINDISGGSLDPVIWDVAARSHAPYILTHYPAGHTPATMQSVALGPEQITQSVLHYFAQHLAELQHRGITHVLLDPGFGFGKTLEANYRLLNDLSQLTAATQPLYVGVSRKSMLWRLLERNPEEVLPATSALHLHALQQGAQILRVHDAAEARDIITLWKQLNA
ncbi:MAG: hypothetical protein ABR98_06715 [Cryomorphaceae bacterium BACL7 MAG-120910-bin2]|jgi:dihydropteroate synthase|nr:MAG: hypothetical protein ABR98_06715 [Cryomorphaceae bacterium BACL7 MAG-120910-bin2]